MCSGRCCKRGGGEGVVAIGVTTQLTAGKCAKMHNKLGQVESEKQQVKCCYLKLISLLSITFIDKLFPANQLEIVESELELIYFSTNYFY